MTEGSGWEDTAQVEGALVSSLAGTAEDCFWRQCHARVIARIRQASELADKPEPDLREVAALASDDNRLRALIATAARSGGSADEHAGEELSDWYRENWFELDESLRRKVATALHKAAECGVTVARRAGAGDGRAPLGERTGPWSEWDAASLPEPLRSAAEGALDEIEKRRERQWEGAGATATGPAEPELRLLASAIAHTVAATRQIADAGSRLTARRGNRPYSDSTAQRASALLEDARNRSRTLLAAVDASGAQIAAAAGRAATERESLEPTGAAAPGEAGGRPAPGERRETPAPR